MDAWYKIKVKALERSNLTDFLGPDSEFFFMMERERGMSLMFLLIPGLLQFASAAENAAQKKEVKDVILQLAAEL